jgi:transcriptional regulator with XRE-family HTH domain
MNAEIRVNFGERLRHERERLKLSQAEIAELGGTKVRTYQDWERGVATVSAEFLARISAHGVDTQYVLIGLRSFDPCAVQHTQPQPTIAARLQQERERLAISQAQLALKIGSNSQTIEKFESGELVPDAKMLLQLHAAGVDIGYVLLSLRSSASAGTLNEDAAALLQDYEKASEEARALVRGVAALAAQSG